MNLRPSKGQGTLAQPPFKLQLTFYEISLRNLEEKKKSVELGGDLIVEMDLKPFIPIG